MTKLPPQARLILLLVLFSTDAAWAQNSFQPIPRKIPPQGIEVRRRDRGALSRSLKRLHQRLDSLFNNEAIRPYLVDVAVFGKAVSYALENGEFYSKRDVSSAMQLLETAHQRAESLATGKHPWTSQRGNVVKGYRSKLDGSVQPYGLEIPEDLDLGKPVALYVWLHGRGDKTPDLQFIQRRMTRSGTVAPANGIILHPFGRYCNAFKLAGEVDVFEAIEAVKRDFSIDENRIALWGFSMGGAGVWHLAAHHPDFWAAASPGAGFAETARYQRLTPDRFPVSYEQTLWGMFDAPGYVRNLFNLPVVAYSGENDKQIQAARVMEEAFADHGRKLPHLIGPGMGHKYHPDTLKQLTRMMEEFVAKGRDQHPPQVWLQTQTLRYNKAFWVEALGLVQHWRDSRIDAQRTGDDDVIVTTKNVASLRLSSPWPDRKLSTTTSITIDGHKLSPSASSSSVALTKSADGWRISDGLHADVLAKQPGLQGPIDDFMMRPFLVVAPDGASKHPAVQGWVDFEFEHFRDRWKRLFRGSLREKKADQITDDDVQTFNLVLWGDRSSNSLIARIIDRLPLDWNDKMLSLGSKQFSADGHVPALIYPNPLNPKRYVVLNSGMTFREGHDRTNSLQNPKLPDWAIIDVGVPPTDLAPGKIVAADFFDEMWRVK